MQKRFRKKQEFRQLFLACYRREFCSLFISASESGSEARVVTLQSRPKNEYFKTKKKAMGLFSKKASSKSQEAPSEPSVTLGDGSSVTVSSIVDCLGDSCPRPQLMTRKAMAAAEPEAIVAILIDNPTSMEAIPPMCPEIDASYLDTLKEDRGWRVILKKNS